MCIIRKDQEEEEGDGLRSVSSSNLESEFGMGPGLGANSTDFKNGPKNGPKRILEKESLYELLAQKNRPNVIKSIE